jgi:hypothetical protein
MLRIRDERTESALCVGVVVAVLWGFATMVRGFFLGPLAISWEEWFLQLLGGVACALILPWVLVRGTDWISHRLEAARQR